MTRIGRAPRLAMATEDFRYLQLLPDHVRLASRREGRLNFLEDLSCFPASTPTGDEVERLIEAARTSSQSPARDVPGDVVFAVLPCWSWMAWH